MRGVFGILLVGGGAVWAWLVVTGKFPHPGGVAAAATDVAAGAVSSAASGALGPGVASDATSGVASSLTNGAWPTADPFTGAPATHGGGGTQYR